MRLEGKALHVGLEIWYRAGLQRRREVVLSLSKVADAGTFDRATAARGLAALERAGLVRVERAVGRAPRVTLLDVELGKEIPEDGDQRRRPTDKLVVKAPEVAARDVEATELTTMIVHGGQRERSYSGKLAENVTHAVCRDLLADALVRPDGAGFEIVLHMHDETVAEVPVHSDTRR
ncbi:MAG: hypothetical protein ACLP1X_10200 [Polyangiaceae bacterium]